MKIESKGFIVPEDYQFLLDYEESIRMRSITRVANTADGSATMTYHEDMPTTWFYIKIFQRNEIKRLSPNACWLFMWIAEHLGYEEITVEVTPKRVAEDGMTEYAYCKAIKELLQLKIIGKGKRRGTYDVNLKYMMRGNAKLSEASLERVKNRLNGILTAEMAMMQMGKVL